MPAFEMPLDELVQRRTGTPTPDDLREFWSGTLAEARGAVAEPKAEPVETGLRLVRTWDVTFSGYGGDPIRAWYHLPADASDSAPVVVHYQGYGGGRGLAHQVPWWTMAGYACLEVDTRGQGSGHTAGDTPDPTGSGPAHPGYMTRGILDPQTYYYRRVFTDAVLAVDAVKSLPGADPGRVAVSGGSQGGAMAIAVGSLRDDLAAVLSDVPFLSDFRRAVEMATTKPYTELYQYLSVHRDHVERVFHTLAYFDGAEPGAVLGRADGRDLPAIDGVRGLQRVRRPEGDHRLPVQRPRGRRCVPPARPAALPPGTPRRDVLTAPSSGLPSRQS